MRKKTFNNTSSKTVYERFGETGLTEKIFLSGVTMGDYLQRAYDFAPNRTNAVKVTLVTGSVIYPSTEKTLNEVDPAILKKAYDAFTSMGGKTAPLAQLLGQTEKDASSRHKGSNPR